jgi:hypothetical protein
MTSFSKQPHMKNDNRPSDASEPDYSWKSKTKEELNAFVRLLWNQCKTRLMCPNCEHVGNISTSSANGELRLQCITKGLQNGTKKGQCNKSWSLDNSIIVLKYATETRPTENVKFWWEKPCHRRDVGPPTASTKSIKNQLFSQQVPEPQTRFLSSMQGQPVAILKRTNHIEPVSPAKNGTELSEAIIAQERDFIATQVMKSRLLPNASLGETRTFSPHRSNDKSLLIGTQVDATTLGRQKQLQSQVNSSQSNFNRGKQSPFQSLSVKRTQPMATKHCSPVTPVVQTTQHEAREVEKRNFNQLQDVEFGLIREFSSSQQQKFDQQEQLIEFNDDVIERQFNQKSVALGSGSDAYLLTGLTKRIPGKLSTQQRRKC